MLDKLLTKSLVQLQKIDDILSYAKSSISSISSMDDGDRVWFTYQSSFDFVTNDTKVQNLNFTVSNDADFVAKRLVFDTKFNRDPTDPTGFFHSAQPPYESNAFTQFAIDFQVEIYESYHKDGNLIHRPYQDSPIPAFLTYSRNNPSYGSPSAMCFDLNWDIERGSVVQCKISVINASPGAVFNEATDTDIYRIIGMLEGYKKVRAFK